MALASTAQHDSFDAGTLVGSPLTGSEPKAPVPPARFGIGPNGVMILKWGASIVQILGYSATAFGMTPLNIYLFLVGLIGWFAVGVIWRDKAIMLIHVVALVAMGAGLLSSAGSAP
ncbi:Ubiquinone/menaquinone biosynthesis methyltransferase [Sulfitobacter noctilucae]|nr:Ubiquinone/menaquinone biosynthesis methyltransferase [Sulfitobacter noctilucae]